MKDLLYAVIGLIAAVGAVYEIYHYLSQRASSADFSHSSIIIGVICAIIALICGGLFLSNRVNRQEEIHITE